MKKTATDVRAARLETEAKVTELRAKMFAAARVDLDDLQSEFARMSAELAFWGARTAFAHIEYLRAQARSKRLYGFFALRARDDLEEERGQGARNVTEAMVDAAVRRNDDWREIEEDEFTARLAYEEHKSQMAALSAKRDMLMQLGADRRREWELDPSIRETKIAHKNRNTRSEDDDGEEE